MSILDRNAKSNIVIGDIVKVFSHSYEGFFRAKIINIDNINVYVSYIDFGNTETVQLDDIFELTDELKEKEVWQKSWAIYVLTFKIIFFKDYVTNSSFY